MKNYGWILALARSKKSHLSRLREIFIVERDCNGPDDAEVDEWELEQRLDVWEALDEAGISLKVVKRSSNGKKREIGHKLKH
jgi:hypothetical protein